MYTLYKQLCCEDVNEVPHGGVQLQALLNTENIRVALHTDSAFVSQIKCQLSKEHIV